MSSTVARFAGLTRSMCRIKGEAAGCDVRETNIPLSKQSDTDILCSIRPTRYTFKLLLNTCGVYREKAFYNVEYLVWSGCIDRPIAAIRWRNNIRARIEYKTAAQSCCEDCIYS